MVIVMPQYFLLTLSFGATPQGHTGDVIAVSFHNEKPWLLSASRDSTVRLWDFTTGRQIYRIAAHASGISCMATHTHMRSYSFMDQEESDESQPTSPTPQDLISLKGLRSHDGSFQGSQPSSPGNASSTSLGGGVKDSVRPQLSP